MEKLTKEQEIDFIAGRIIDEFRKHYTSLNNDWHKIAASKIHSQWKEYWTKELENKLSIEERQNEMLISELNDLKIQMLYTNEALTKISESGTFIGAKFIANDCLKHIK